MEDFKGKLETYLQKKDWSSMAQLLEEISIMDISKSGIWNLRKYYRALREEQLINSPVLLTALALLSTISADFERAKECVDTLQEIKERFPKHSRQHREAEQQLIFLELAMPQKQPKNLLISLRNLVKIAAIDKKTWPIPSISTGRPSIANGGRDFTAYWRYSSWIKEMMKGYAKILYGNSGVGMAEIAIAEGYYQRNDISEALIQTVGIIPFIEQQGDVNVLFAAMFLQMSIMMVSGQIPSAKPMLMNIEKKIRSAKALHLLPNISAIYAWTALYDKDYTRINQWMEGEAPDETADFCTLDRFQYFVKLRVYLMQGKFLAFLALAERLRPILIAFDRKMEQCELFLLCGLSLYAQGEKERAFDMLEEALRLGEKYKYYRLFGDEGEKLYVLLCDYRSVRGGTSFLNAVIGLTKQIALLYPHYLKARKEFYPALTQTETEVLQLMATDKTNDEIATFLQISINTVKFHSKNIYAKLDVKNRGQAVGTAKEIGVL